MKALLTITLAIALLGCQSLPDIGGIIPTPEQPETELPTNPVTGPDLPGSISEQWSMKLKDYDNTYRITWPSTFAREYGVGAGSYCTVGPHRAAFRGIDADHGAMRPKYTLPLSASFDLPVTCILYNASGEAVGWFVADQVGINGTLPDQGGSQ
jgi:hypothetical protein